MYVKYPGESEAYYGGIVAATANFGLWKLKALLCFFSSQNSNR